MLLDANGRIDENSKLSFAKILAILDLWLVKMYNSIIYRMCISRVTLISLLKKIPFLLIPRYYTKLEKIRGRILR